MTCKEDMRSAGRETLGGEIMAQKSQALVGSAGTRKAEKCALQREGLRKYPTLCPAEVLLSVSTAKGLEKLENIMLFLRPLMPAFFFTLGPISFEHCGLVTSLLSMEGPLALSYPIQHSVLDFCTYEIFMMAHS